MTTLFSKTLTLVSNDKTFSLFSKTQSAEKSSDLLNGNAGPAAGWQPLTQPEDKGEQFFIRVSGFLIRVSVFWSYQCFQSTFVQNNFVQNIFV